MTKKCTFISISLPETLKEKVEDHLAASDFGNVSEYVRTLIRADLEREQKLVAWRKIREAQTSVRPAPEQAAKPVEAQEQEIFDIVGELRHGSKHLETKLLEGLHSGEPEDVTPEYLEKLSQDGGEMMSRKETQQPTI